MTADQRILWDKAKQFDLDHPPSEYGFSIRLAKENYWTKSFTERAILEYKKFMFLAATSDMMVSPSAIVDTVWHQHLIFTQSYQEFCTLLGKQIQHIPSTHNREDFQKFRQAKERTTVLYESVFGKQPHAIWHYNDMYESLNLQKAKLKLRSFIIIGIGAFIVLTAPFYFLLRPLYITIGNPAFMLGFIFLAGITFLVLELYNRSRLNRITRQFDPESFVYELQPYELIYLKTQKLSNVIHGVVNELVKNKTIAVLSNNTMELSKNGQAESIEQLHVTSMLSLLGRTVYPKLMYQLVRKPLFGNIVNSMEAFKKYFNKSLKFGKLFYFNFSVLAVLLLLAFTRLTTGILRDKPVVFIAITIVVLAALIYLYLNRLTRLVCTKTIPGRYREEIVPTLHDKNSPAWRYFLLGSAVLTASLATLIDYFNNSNSIGGSGTSDMGGGCGSSCGSSCSSCGGCGGSGGGD
ncbi:DUF1399 domain-containing protein [Fluviicola sp.]|uniref:glycine-rich domain-containing protein n=1 Tax=Fluviicola sp. TaxID=1917219 RepID=UPI0031D3DAE1